jgi:protein-tyrosine phosphatase
MSSFAAPSATVVASWLGLTRCCCPANADDEVIKTASETATSMRAVDIGNPP